MYGFAILTSKLLCLKLAPHRYYELLQMPGLWWHVLQTIHCSLAVDDFGVKYVATEHAEHMSNTLGKNYSISEDWMEQLHCGITLSLHYEGQNIWMPNYVYKQLTRYKHQKPTKPQTAPCKTVQEPMLPDKSPLFPDNKIKFIQFIGSFLYYCWAVDHTILHVLSSIATLQAQSTHPAKKKIHQFLDYMPTHPNAIVCFHPLDMILNIHSNTS